MIQTIHQTFSCHGRQFCIFPVAGRNEEFLYYSHTSHPLRSLMFGRIFTGQVLRLMETEELCIGCGLGVSVAGGIALENRDCIAWHCSVMEANRKLTGLKDRLGAEGQWIELF